MANPYNDPRYGGALSATRGFLDSYERYMKMRHEMGQAEIQNQYRRSLMAQHARSGEMFATKQKWERRTEDAFLAAPPEKQQAYLLSKGGTTVNLMQPRTRKDYRTIVENSLFAAGTGKVSTEKTQKALDWAIEQLGPDATKDEIATMKTIFDNAASIGVQGATFDWPPKPEGYEKPPGFLGRMKSKIGGWLGGTDTGGPPTPFGPQEQPAPQANVPPSPVDYDRIEKMLGKKNADMEQKAWGIVYDVWNQLPRKLQDAIRAKEKEGVSFTEILQYDEVKQAVRNALK